jgi:hypothetical protein
MQPQIHLIDETWIDAPPDTVSVAVADPANWRRWWPSLYLTVTRDRGRKGIQWAAMSQGPARPELRGTVEIWLEPFRTGVILHHYLRLDAVAGPLSRRGAERRTARLARHAKRMFWQLKDEFELSEDTSGG